MATGFRAQRQSAAVFLFDEAGRVLLVRENYGHRRYGPPGGLVEPGESPQDAAIREAHEEAGVIVCVNTLVGIVFHANDVEDWLGFAFAGSIVSGTPAITDPGEIAEIGWYDPRNAPGPLSPVGRVFMSDACDGLTGIVRSVSAPRRPPAGDR